jgi:hypothetical protein
VWHATDHRESVDVWADVGLNNTKGRYSVLEASILLCYYIAQPSIQIFKGK